MLTFHLTPASDLSYSGKLLLLLLFSLLVRLPSINRRLYRVFGTGTSACVQFRRNWTLCKVLSLWRYDLPRSEGGVVEEIAA